MSIHKSFKDPLRLKHHRSVLNRLERVRILQEEDRLPNENFSALSLPKVRNIKETSTKLSKEEREKEKADEAAGKKI